MSSFSQPLSPRRMVSGRLLGRTRGIGGASPDDERGRDQEEGRYLRRRTTGMKLQRASTKGMRRIRVTDRAPTGAAVHVAQRTTPDVRLQGLRMDGISSTGYADQPNRRGVQTKGPLHGKRRKASQSGTCIYPCHMACAPTKAILMTCFAQTKRSIMELFLYG